MMVTETARCIVAALFRRGFELVAAGNRLRCRPASALTDDLRQRILSHKAELILALSAALTSSSKAPCGEYDSEYHIWFTADATEKDKQAARAVAAIQRVEAEGLVRQHGLANGRVPAEWSVEGWVDYCQFRADRCDDDHPEVAAWWRAQAAVVEAA